mmetsp:Transcript_16814/g.16062  ORF Transcript_16814/g.16062 Transcript_16814/m.16062 type:complete len:99 (-) Transcript_16814:357-653(-)
MFMDGMMGQMDFEDEMGGKMGQEDEELTSIMTKNNQSQQNFARGKKGTKFAAFHLGVKKRQERKGQHISYNILKKLQQKDKRLLKDIMPKKMLLRIIS